MYRVWIFICLLAFGWSFSCCNATGIDRDSLMSYVGSLPDNEAKIDTLISLGNKLNNEGRGISMELLKQAEELNDSIGDLSQRLRIFLDIASQYDQLNLFNLALEYLLEAREIAVELEEDEQLAWIFNSIGNAHKEKKNFKQATEYYNESSDRLKSLNIGIRVSYPLINMASMLHSQGENDSALALYERVLDEFPADPASFRNVVIYNNLGNLYKDMGEFDKSRHFSLLALRLKAKRGDELMLPNTTNNLASLYLEMEMPDSADYYLDSTRRVCARLEISKYQDETLGLEAELARLKGDYQKAYTFLEALMAKRDSVHQADRASDMENLFALFEKEQQEAEIKLLKQENDVINARSRAQFLAILGLVLFLLLLTVVFFVNRSLNLKLKQANQDLSLKNEQIKEQQEKILHQNETVTQKNQKLEDLIREKDGIIQFVAHDLKAPINKTLALLELVEADMDGQKAQLIKMIKESNLNAKELIKDLLLINSVEHEGPKKVEERINLTELIQKKIRSFKLDADRKNINLTSILTGKTSQVCCTESDISRILDNFISNAIKFSDPGTSVEVGIRDQAGPLVTLFVKDEGPGISREDQKKMFKKFQKLTARPTGGESSHGLGLAIVKSLAEKMGGEIRMESEIGKGTTFELLIPA